VINLIPQDRINYGSKSIGTSIINNFSLYDSAFQPSYLILFLSFGPLEAPIQWIFIFVFG